MPPDHIVEINEMVVSRNKLDSMHWSKRSKYSKLWEARIIVAFRFRCPQATGKVKIKITSCRPRILDQDNFIGGCKGIIDAMKRLGMIVDDTPKLIDVEYEQVFAPAKEAKTILEVS